jgi:hypothetical protein
LKRAEQANETSAATVQRRRPAPPSSRKRTERENDRSQQCSSAAIEKDQRGNFRPSYSDDSLYGMNIFFSLFNTFIAQKRCRSSLHFMLPPATVIRLKALQRLFSCSGKVEVQASAQVLRNAFVMR